MNTKYIDLICLTYDFLQDEFAGDTDGIKFHNIDLKRLVKTCSIPTKFTCFPVYEKDNPLYIMFFNGGAHQEAINRFRGLQHCLIPNPKDILPQKDEDSSPTSDLFNNNKKVKIYSKF